ncbi:hypothetical protein LINPERHAP1_LOCUS13565 [Linum perenne]
MTCWCVTRRANPLAFCCCIHNIMRILFIFVYRDATEYVWPWCRTHGPSILVLLSFACDVETGGGCGVGLGLGWGFGSAFGSHYRSSTLNFHGAQLELRKKDEASNSNTISNINNTREVRDNQ